MPKKKIKQKIQINKPQKDQTHTNTYNHLDEIDQLLTELRELKKIQEPKFWEAPTPPCATECSWAKQYHDTFTIPYHVFIKIRAMMNSFPDREWLGYIIQDGDSLDLFIPEQVAHTTTVTNVKTPPDLDIVAVIHSHHSMGAFFSSMDRETVNMNHPVSIVVSSTSKGNSLEFKAVRKLQLPCGMILQQEIDVDIEDEPVDPNWLQDALSRVKEPEPPKLSYIVSPGFEDYLHERG
ncbi:MAG: Mov34/MPN/PAD-1 family protein [Nitrososphaerota archaeon]